MSERLRDLYHRALERRANVERLVHACYTVLVESTQAWARHPDFQRRLARAQQTCDQALAETVDPRKIAATVLETFRAQVATTPYGQRIVEAGLSDDLDLLAQNVAANVAVWISDETFLRSL